MGRVRIALDNGDNLGLFHYFFGYINADWSGAIGGQQSTGRWLIMLGGAPIS